MKSCRSEFWLKLPAEAAWNALAPGFTVATRRGFINITLQVED